MALKDKPNPELLRLYDDTLVLRIHNQKNLRDTRHILSAFKDHLGDSPPSEEAAKSFLVRYAHLQPRTRYRYTQMIQAFMSWYGLPLKGVKVRIPKSLPAYVDTDDIERLLAAASNKRGYKDKVERDQLLIKTIWRIGLRRAELARLTPGDIHQGFLIVRNGKGEKDRTIPLVRSLDIELAAFTAGMERNQPVFGLGTGTISNKVKQIAKRVGLPDIHTHSHRHKFATDLLERGVNIRLVQELLGHENLNTTQVYLGITDTHLKDAINRLEEPVASEATPEPTDTMPGEKLSDRAETDWHRYQETLHTRQIRKLARNLADSISLPSLLDKDLWRGIPADFKPGEYYLPIGKIGIDEKKQVKVNYREIGPGIAEPHLVKGLFGHISTSGFTKFAELTGNNGKLESLSDNIGQYYQALLTLLILISDEVKSLRTGVLLDSEGEAGLIKWFIISIWIDSQIQARGDSWIDDTWYKDPEPGPTSGLRMLKCGSDFIGIAANCRTLKAYEKRYKTLRTKYAESPFAKNIANKHRYLSDEVQEITQLLHEFSDMQSLPGHCNLC